MFFIYQFVILLQMKSKTANNFRLKIKENHSISRKQNSSRYKPTQSQEPINSSFSHQYVSLARKCKIKLIPHNLNSILPIQIEVPLRDDSQLNKIKTRFKTDCTRRTRKYKMQFLKTQNQNKEQSPIKMIESKYQSVSVYTGPSHPQVRSDKQLLFPSHHIKYSKKRQKSLFTHIMLDEINPIINEDAYKIKLIINEDEQQNNLIKLSYHCKKIYKLKKSLQKGYIQYKQILKYIKDYILKQQGCSLSKLNSSIQQPQYKIMIKKLIIYERIIIISIVNFIMYGKLQQHLQEINRSIQIILGFWYQIINHTYKESSKSSNNNYTQVENVIIMLSQAKLLTKSNLQLLLQTIIIKVKVLNKSYHLFYEKINNLVLNCQKYSINRSFYQLLTMFSVYLTDLECKNKVNIDFVLFFATCPSPYVITSSTKSYTLVLDLDETLLHSNYNKSTRSILYRPGYLQFMQQLSQHYQIIIFTTSLQSYAREVTKSFATYIDHFLFRQHAMRVQHRFIKDLSRLGRNLSKTIIIDDIADNFQLQKDNGIAIKAWNGDDQNDKQLHKIKYFLMNLAMKIRPNDVRQYIKLYKTQVKDKKSQNKQQKIPKQEAKLQHSHNRHENMNLQTIKQENVQI